MEYAFSVFMFCFGGAILLYAGIMGLTKDIGMIPFRYRHVVKMKDKKAHAVMLAKILSLTAIAPFAGGLAGLLSPMLGMVVLIVSFIVCIWIGVKRFYS